MQKVDVKDATVTAIRVLNRHCTCRDNPCSCPEYSWTGAQKVLLQQYVPLPDHFFVGGVVGGKLRVCGDTVKGITPEKGFMLYREADPFVIFDEAIYFIVNMASGEIKEALVSE